MRGWSFFALLLLPSACAAPEPKSARDELLFELPEWCGKGRRQGWTTWDGARKAQPDGAAVCGVRLPGGTDDGVCVVLTAGRVTRAVVASRGERRREVELEQLETSRGWAIVESLPETLVRIDGETLMVRARGTEVEGPCFHGPAISVASFAGETTLRAVE